MAKIKVYDTTKKVNRNARELIGKVDELKSDVDQYIRLLNEAKAKAERKAHELEEKKRQQELAAEQKRQEEESRLKARKQEEEKQREEQAKALEEQEPKQKDAEKEKAEEQQKQEKPEQKKQDSVNRKTSQDRNRKDQRTKKPEDRTKKPEDRTKKPEDRRHRETQETRNHSGKSKFDNPRKEDRAKRNGNPRSGDIVGRFLAQPPVTADKEKSDNGKGPGRYAGQSKDKKKKSRKDYWEEFNYHKLTKHSRKTKKGKQNKPHSAMVIPERKKAITMGDRITVKELSETIGIQVAEIIKKLMGLGIMATINMDLDYDTANLVASEFHVELERKAVKTYEEQLKEEDTQDTEENLIKRPPVVTVMGHVDHGKTSLLDAIRHSHVIEGEAGGITQHIGAYTVNVKDKMITFLDTPGHEAFTSMRARGAQVTDVAVLVVAADDGVMPQTIEAINHAKAAGVPIVVAINKMDKPGANPDRVKKELSEHGLVVEEWGGDTIAVPISALKKEGISDVLEMILLVAEVQDLKANPNRLAKGTIIEAQLDKGRGPVATILVQNGTLHVGDSIVAGTKYGRVRAMMDDKGCRIEKAGPSMPVEVLGLNDVPDAGDIIYAVEDDKLAKQVSEERKAKKKAEQVKVAPKATLDELFNQLKEGEIKDLNLIIKADVQGSAEAVKQALEKLSNDQIRVQIIHDGVGAVTESDVLLAVASNAIIIGFNVRPSASSLDLAEKEGVDIRTYRVIYQAIEDIEAAMKGMLDPEFREVVIGHASVRTTFKISGTGTIAGCYVNDGKITRNASVRIVRDGVVVSEAKIESLKRFKDDVREVAANYECGIGLENYNDIKEGDVFEAFVQEEIKR